jgi:hypothetical protein
LTSIRLGSAVRKLCRRIRGASDLLPYIRTKLPDKYEEAASCGADRLSKDSTLFRQVSSATTLEPSVLLHHIGQDQATLTTIHCHTIFRVSSTVIAVTPIDLHFGVCIAFPTGYSASTSPPKSAQKPRQNDSRQTKCRCRLMSTRYERIPQG